MRDLPLTFDYSTCSQKKGEDFAKFCGLLRIYDLNYQVLTYIVHSTNVKAKIFLQNRKPKKNPFIREIDREKTSEKG